MKKAIFCFLIITLATSPFGYSQQITCSAKDKQAFEDKIIEIDGLLEKDLGKTLVAIR